MIRQPTDAMKKIITVLTLLLVLTACRKSNDESKPSTTSLLQHIWKLDSMYVFIDSGHKYYDRRDSIYDFTNTTYMVRHRYSQYTSAPLTDTLTYVLQSDSSTIYFRSLINGVVSQTGGQLKSRLFRISS